jgi:hypothetical protein
MCVYRCVWSWGHGKTGALRIDTGSHSLVPIPVESRFFGHSKTVRVSSVPPRLALAFASLTHSRLGQVRRPCRRTPLSFLLRSRSPPASGPQVPTHFRAASPRLEYINCQPSKLTATHTSRRTRCGTGLGVCGAVTRAGGAYFHVRMAARLAARAEEGARGLSASYWSSALT